MKSIIVVEYPQTFSFKVRKELPPFEYGCETRWNILQYQFKKQKIESPCHLWSEYVLEFVKSDEEFPDTEYWYLGS